MPFVGLVPILQEDVAYRLRSVATLALVGLGLVDRIEVCAQADLAGAYLRYHRTNRSVCILVCLSIAFPGQAPSLKSSLPCLAFSLECSSS